MISPALATYLHGAVCVRPNGRRGADLVWVPRNKEYITPQAFERLINPKKVIMRNI